MNTMDSSANPQISLAQIGVFDNEYGFQCISARELHEKLEIETRFNDWFPRICEYGFLEGTDFYSNMSKTLTGGRPQTDYQITIEMAKQICMLQRTEKGRQYREYFIKLEKAWNSPEAVMARALQVANRTLEETKKQVELQKIEIEELKPDAESWRAFAESDGSFSATNVARCLGISRDDVLNFLQLRGYIMRDRSTSMDKKGDWIGTCLGTQKGYVKNYIYTNPKGSWMHFHLTPKGMQRVEKAFRSAPLTDDEIEMAAALKDEAKRKMYLYSIGRAE